MASLLFFGLLIAVSIVLRATVGESSAGFILTIVGILVTITYQKLVERLNYYDTQLAAKPIFRPIVEVVRRLSTKLVYADLVVLLIACLLVASTIFDAFVYAIEDLLSKGFLSFPRGDDGFVHLQLYLGGFVAIPLWFFSLSIFAFHKGFNSGSLALLKLVTTISIAFVSSVVLLSVLRGEFLASENYAAVAKANPETLPVGATAMPLAISFGLILSFWVISAFWTWAFSWIGLGGRRIYGNSAKSA